MEPVELTPLPTSLCRVRRGTSMEPMELILGTSRCMVIGTGTHMEPMELILGSNPIAVLTQSAVCTFYLGPITHDRVVPISGEWQRLASVL